MTRDEPMDYEQEARQRLEQAAAELEVANGRYRDAHVQLNRAMDGAALAFAAWQTALATWQDAARTGVEAHG